jgi:hypothetical protein
MKTRHLLFLYSSIFVASPKPLPPNLLNQTVAGKPTSGKPSGLVTRLPRSGRMASIISARVLTWPKNRVASSSMSRAITATGCLSMAKPSCSGPARSDLQNWNYETVDIAPYLTAGKNTLAAVVTYMAEYAPFAQMNYQFGFIVQGDGDAEQVVNTNKTWKIYQNLAYTPVINDIPKLRTYIVVGAGDRVDAARYPWGWEEPHSTTQRGLAAKPVGWPAKPRGFGTDGNWNLVHANHSIHGRIPATTGHEFDGRKASMSMMNFCRVKTPSRFTATQSRHPLRSGPSDERFSRTDRQPGQGRSDYTGLCGSDGGRETTERQP